MTRRPVRAMIALSTLLLSNGVEWLVVAQQPQQNEPTAANFAPKAIDVTRFEQQIQAFEKSDTDKPPPKNAILFTGSSSIRQWHKNLEEDFKGITVIGRGFGGSTMPELLHYMDRLVIRYEPRAVVVYEGDNDLSAGRNLEQLLSDYRKFYKRLRKELPDCHIYILAIKPSPSRQKLWPIASEANEKLKSWCDSRKNLTFVDVATPMLDENGSPDSKLFLKDMLHMNRSGYAIWKEALNSHLMKEESSENLARK